MLIWLAFIKELFSKASGRVTGAKEKARERQCGKEDVQVELNQ
jgi:hypothetical protein